MFIDQQNENDLDAYVNLLKTIGALSNLFSDNEVPYLYYRTAENAFCRSFKATNLSRGDISVDAKKNSLGIGLKTFLNQNKNNSYQKIAEFNKARHLYVDLIGKKDVLVNKISELRNKRIELTINSQELNEVIYHSVIRDKGRFYLSEELMDMIDIESIKHVKEISKNSIQFEDNKSEYKFDLSKSTLYKRFYTRSLLDFEVKIFSDPYQLLENIYANNLNLLVTTTTKYEGIVILPLYSNQGGRHVPERSGLNQWNAQGRRRHEKEVYIPIPSWIHSKFDGFFPNRDINFELVLPSGKSLSAKVCQSGDKALMSNPNCALGEWLLDDVLQIETGKLVTIEMLDEIGIDSVEVRKVNENLFELDFKKTGSYERFYETNN